MELKRVGPWSVGRMFGIMYAVMGLVFGTVFAFITILGNSLGQGADDEQGAFGALFGVGAIVMFPLLYGLGGLVGGLFSAWLYNVFAGMIGGIEVQLDAPRDPTYTGSGSV